MMGGCSAVVSIAIGVALTTILANYLQLQNTEILIGDCPCCETPIKQVRTHATTLAALLAFGTKKRDAPVDVDFDRAESPARTPHTPLDHPALIGSAVDSPRSRDISTKVGVDSALRNMV